MHLATGKASQECEAFFDFYGCSRTQKRRIKKQKSHPPSRGDGMLINLFHYIVFFILQDD